MGSLFSFDNTLQCRYIMLYLPKMTMFVAELTRDLQD